MSDAWWKMDWLRLESRIRNALRSINEGADPMTALRAIDDAVGEETCRGRTLLDSDDTGEDS